MEVNNIIELTITEAGDHLAHGSLTSSELLEATLTRIEETEPRLHAYVNVLADTARIQARQADQELQRRYWRGPLHGIPIAVKDLVYTRDAPTEAGSRVLAGFVPDYDATVVSRLRDAGAVIVGKTVTHEFAYGQNVPPTRNAWNPACYPGGSSAGSGVAVAARSAFGAIGTDTGGSIRIPASLNGVAGLKPTFGRVSRHGVIPMSASLDQVGPITRTVEDCARMLGAIAGPDLLDSSSIDEPVPDYCNGLEAGVKGMRLGVERAFFFYGSVAGEVRAAVEAAIEDLERQGATLVELDIPELDLVMPVGFSILFADTSAWHRRLLRQHGSKYVPATRVMLELGELVLGTQYVTAQKVRTFLRERMRTTFEMHRLDCLVGPTVPVTTMPLEELSVTLSGSSESALAAYAHNCFVANVTGQPALTIPCGFSTSGLPIGLQFLGRPFAEQTLLRIARAYESIRPWHTRRPEISNTPA